MNFNAFLETLPIMGYGMLGIFVVIGVIYLSVLVISKLTIKPKPQRQTPKVL